MSKKTIIEANGLGNSFLIVDEGKTNIDKLSTEEVGSYRELLVRSGRDSLLIIADLSEGIRKQMRVLEKDGSESQMCGNGLRAVARYYYEAEHQPRIEVQTKSGLVTAEQKSGQIIKTSIGQFNYRGFLLADDQIIHDTDVGEPHAIIFSSRDHADALFNRYAPPIVHRGKLVGRNQTMNHHTRNLNVVSIDPLDPTVIYNRTYERGVNHETLACGTGSACAAMTYGKNILRQEQFLVTVKTRLGSLEVAGVNNQVSVTGEAQIEKIIRD